MKKLLAIAIIVGACFAGSEASAQTRPKECRRWITSAITIGWEREELATLAKVLYRESRCIPTSFNPDDPMGGSHGLLQINGFWCQPSRYYPNGYLQSLGLIESCQDLYRPLTNLRAGLAIWRYSEKANQNGWSPWAL